MKSIANQYRDLKEGKMSEANFMRNLRMTMPQYVTNTTSFSDAVKILKNKSIIVESYAGNDQWLDAFQDALGFKTYMSPSYLIGQYGDMKPEDAARKFMDDSTESAMAKDKEKFAKETGLNEATLNEVGGESDSPDNPKLQAAAKYLVQNRDRYLTQDYWSKHGIRMLSVKSDEELYDYIVNKIHSDGVYDTVAHMKAASQNEDGEELGAMVKKMEDEKAGEEAVKSQYDLGEAKPEDKEFDEEEEEEETYDFEYDEDEMFNPAYMNEAKKKEEKVEYSKQQANPTELRLGIRTELECDSDMELDKAKEIAYKNIIKDPIYYTKLKLSGVEAHPKKVKGEKEVPAKKKKETIQLVDLVNGMQKVKMPKKEEKKKLKEARFNVIGEPNEVAKQAMQFVDGNNTLKALSDDIVIQQTSDPNEALLRFGYWDALPSEAVEKLKLQFNVEKDSDSDEDTGEIIFYRLTPLRNFGSKDLGGSFEKMKKSLEEIVHETISEYFDGRDNLINPLSAEDENN